VLFCLGLNRGHLTSLPGPVRDVTLLNGGWADGRQSRRRQTLQSRRTLSGRSSSSPSIETIQLAAPSAAATSSDKNATLVLVIIVVVFVVCATPELVHRLVSTVRRCS